MSMTPSPNPDTHASTHPPPPPPLLHARWLAIRRTSPQANPPSSNLSRLVSNEYVEQEWALKAPQVLAAKARGAACFDFDYYRSSSGEDLHALPTRRALWKHFVYYGQFEGRPYRCGGGSVA